MENCLIPFLICVVATTVCEGATRLRKEAAPTRSPASRSVTNFERDVQPILSQYCYSCHGETKKKADLSLQEFRTEAHAIQNREVWERVLHNMRTREMPPSNKSQPTQAQRDV